MTGSRRVGSCESTERPLNPHFLGIGLRVPWLPHQRVVSRQLDAKKSTSDGRSPFSRHGLRDNTAGFRKRERFAADLGAYSGSASIRSRNLAR